MRGLVLLLATAACVCSLAATATAQTSFTRQLPAPGAEYWRAETKAQQTLTIFGQPVETQSRQDIVLRSEYTPPGDDGLRRANHRIERLVSQLSLPGQMELKFDSRAPQPPDNELLRPIHDILAAVAKAQWTEVYNAELLVERVEGIDKSLMGLDPAVADLVRGQFDPAYLKDKANTELARLPREPVMKGDTWEASEVFRLENNQSLKATRRYRYVGAAEHDGAPVEQIDSEVLAIEYDWKTPDDAPVRFKEAKLKPMASSGRLLFDPARGRVVLDEQKMHVTGELTFIIGGADAPSTLDMRLETTARLLAEPPADAPAP